MKPTNKRAAYIQDVWLREYKRWHHSPSDAERNCRRFWKRQASRAARYSPAYHSPWLLQEHWDDWYVLDRREATMTPDEREALLIRIQALKLFYREQWDRALRLLNTRPGAR